MKNFEIFPRECVGSSLSNGNEIDMEQKTTKIMVQSQHDCQVVWIS